MLCATWISKNALSEGVRKTQNHKTEVSVYVFIAGLSMRNFVVTWKIQQDLFAPLMTFY
jgi:hypothetical protein